MRLNILQRFITSSAIFVLVSLVAVYLVFGKQSNSEASDGAAASIAQYQKLVDGRCSGSEAVNRSHLQQTWFDTPDYSNVAMAFGQYSFSTYGSGALGENREEGAFCIEDKTLEVVYLQLEFKFSWGDLFSKFELSWKGRREPLTDGKITILHLDAKVLRLRIEENGVEKTFYRKN